MPFNLFNPTGATKAYYCKTGTSLLGQQIEPSPVKMPANNKDDKNALLCRDRCDARSGCVG